jgi:hypothetical protein
MKKDMRSVHARARLEKDPMMENSMLVETK